ncbi:hypothetical protein F0267_01070 [Vibrio coralliilyticus]|uniref:Uncharacterized protein n=1 Tax=Vibrio coralliilyticus TaxID=190893 RepID=A0AAN0SKQ0_9VIBR|nr:hypothetical protein [Vibrio coralliilyticus]AIW22708.1 hypothetical protein IX92_27035 [Vibrio coralliilyticus]NOH36813.1 hypothetical protein [Vibrio coralliilyticus]
MSKYRISEMYADGVYIDTTWISGRWLMILICFLLCYGYLDAASNGYPNVPLLPILSLAALPFFFVRKRLSIYQIKETFVVVMETRILEFDIRSTKWEVPKKQLTFNKGTVSGKLFKRYESSLDTVDGRSIVMLGDLKNAQAEFIERQLFREENS